MKQATVIFIIWAALIGCSKDTPTETTNDTAIQDITFAGTLDTITYWSWSDTLRIFTSCMVPAGTNPYTVDTILAANTDTMYFHLYLSNGKNIHNANRLNYSIWDGTTAKMGTQYCVEGYGTSFPCPADSIKITDTTTTVDSLIVFYSYWRQIVRYGPYKNKYKNPPIRKLVY